MTDNPNQPGPGQERPGPPEPSGRPAESGWSAQPPGSAETGRPAESAGPAGPAQPAGPDEQTRVLPADEAPTSSSAEPGKVRRFAGHRATQLVGAGLVGLLIGGGAVALFDRDDRERDFGRGAFAGRMEERMEDRFEDGRGGPFMRGEHPPGQWKDRVRDRMAKRMIPEHHHNEDGEVVPGPAPSK